ncbi:hypothetical protein [Halobacillus litoralis]|uniref:hypothetical protein n=1 Tax=Halobacillus litoralis TaxID=45668 RepID=UPI001CFC7F19|nr:hypothetical protein [Halobacillus litoralis]
MKHFFYKNQEGYVLLTVLLMFTIFSILGLSLMSYTIGSQKFSEVNTSLIETQADAEMKVQEAHAYIKQGVGEINQYLSSGHLNTASLDSSIDTVIQDAQTQFDEDVLIKDEVLKDGAEGVYLQRVDVKVSLDDSDKTLIRTLTISSVSDVFQYSVVTPGDLNINGAPYIKGDVYVGENLHLRNQASLVDEERIDTSYPAIPGGLSVGEGYYVSEDFDEKKVLENDLERYFSVLPRMIDPDPGLSSIPVTEMIQEKKNHPMGEIGAEGVPGNVDRIEGYKVIKKGYKRKGKSNKAPDYFEGDTYIRGDLDLEGSQLSVGGNLIVDGDLTVSSSDDEQGILDVNGSIYVRGNADLSGHITISESGFMYISGIKKNGNCQGNNESNNKCGVMISDLTFNGRMYINHKVDIRKDLNMTGTIYTKLGGTVEDLSSESGGSMVIVSDGDLEISSNNLYNNESKEIHAYFYTNSSLDIRGVGSHLRIIGGVYGGNITFNAVKGRVSDEGFPNAIRYGNKKDVLFIENHQDDLRPELSRLSVIYDGTLILNPPAGLPALNQLNVRELDTHYYRE